MPFWTKSKTLDYSDINGRILLGTTPSRANLAELKTLGVKLVINMRMERKSLKSKSAIINTIWVPTLDFRLLPIRPNRLFRAVDSCQRAIDDGGKVYIYCRRGRHRSVAMAAALLISEGKTADEAMALIKQKRASANPDKPHIKRVILEFERLWKSRR